VKNLVRLRAISLLIVGSVCAMKLTENLKTSWDVAWYLILKLFCGAKLTCSPVSLRVVIFSVWTSSEDCDVYKEWCANSDMCLFCDTFN